MELYSTINVSGKQHVVCGAKARGTYSTGEKIPEANYLGTGMALCGILKEGETLKNFEDKKRRQAEARAM